MSKIGTIITGTGRFLPDDRLTNDQLSQMVDTSDEWIVQRTGIRERRIARNSSTLSVALPAAQRALHSAGKDAAEIDLIIACTVTPDTYTPTLSCALQSALGAEHAFAYDLSAACSGFVYAVDTADAYLRSGKANCVLVVCAEVLSRIIDYTDRTTCCLFGDGAGAAVLEYSDSERGILSTYLRADGSRGHALCAPALPFEDPFAPQRESKRRFLQMNGSEVFKFTGRAVPEAIDGVLQREGMQIDAVDWIVPHQANLRILDMLSRRYGLDKEKIYCNLPYVGNTSSASIPICLDEMREQGLLRKGQKLLFVGFGGGLTYGAVLIEI